MSETRFGYQIWKPENDEVRKIILKQMEINNKFKKQPISDSYKLFSEEILSIEEHSELGRHTAGFGLSIYDMLKNYRAFKGEEKFEMGDVVVIYHTYEEGKKLAPCFLTIGNYFYGWDKAETYLLRDYEPVQKSWLEKNRNSQILRIWNTVK